MPASNELISFFPPRAKHGLSFTHLTGKDEIVANYGITSLVTPNANPNGYTVSDALFKPFKEKELYFHLQRLIYPLIHGVLMLVDPLNLFVFPLVTIGLSAMTYGIHLILGNQSTGYLYNFAVESLQGTADILLAPITLLTLITRGISTLLKDAKVYDYDAPAGDLSYSCGSEETSPFAPPVIRI